MGNASKYVKELEDSYRKTLPEEYLKAIDRYKVIFDYSSTQLVSKLDKKQKKIIDKT